MSQTEKIAVKVTLSNKEVLTFASAQELQHWIDNFLRNWSWLENGGDGAVWITVKGLLQNTSNIVNDWMRYPDNPDTVRQVQSSISSVFGQIGDQTKGVLWNAEQVAAIDEAKKKCGTEVAAGMFIGLTRSAVRINHNLPSDLVTGLIQAYLFNHDIDLSGSAHGEVLRGLEDKFRENLSKQDDRLKEIEAANGRLNETQEQLLNTKDQELAALKVEKSQTLDELRAEKAQALDDLIAQKQQEFVEMVAKHESNLKAIEDTFHNKLALQKPIAYWHEKQQRHSILSQRFAIASLITLTVLGFGLACLIYATFGGLAQGENPKSWQVGVTVFAAFFVIWVVRILVRLFLSHQHLSVDAAERVTMVQTFLSLSLEQQDMAKEDRSIILQQLFRTASDGLVKDDAAPPGWLEFLSRKN